MRKRVADKQDAEDWIRLQGIFDDLRRENETLRSKINTGNQAAAPAEPPSEPPSELPKEAVTLLTLIAEYPNERYEREYYHHLALTQTHGEYYFELLTEAGLAEHGSLVIGRGARLRLTKSGRVYCVEHNLI